VQKLDEELGNDYKSNQHVYHAMIAQMNREEHEDTCSNTALGTKRKNRWFCFFYILNPPVVFLLLLFVQTCAPDHSHSALLSRPLTLLAHLFSKILSENIEKNFNDVVPTFLKFMRAIMRQTMIRHLAKHSTNKSAWSKAEDFIQDLLEKNTVLTLENTQMSIDRAQTYMSREEKLHTSTTFVTSTSADSFNVGGGWGSWPPDWDG
jgi:hypothetical protein